MVQQIETLAETFARRGLSAEGQALRKLGEEFRESGSTPESLEGVTVYDKSSVEEKVYIHPLFSHNRETYTVVTSGKENHLTPTENRLLTELEESPNERRSTTELTQRVFGEGYSPTNVKKYILRLRKKIEPNPERPEIIISSRPNHVFKDSPNYVFKDSTKIPLVLNSVEQEQLPETIYSHTAFKYYPERSLIIIDNKIIPLRKIENKLLGLLARNFNKPVTYEMFEPIWQDKENVYLQNALKRHVNSLRHKIEPDNRMWILSVHGIGYRLYDPSKLNIPN